MRALLLLAIALAETPKAPVGDATAVRASILQVRADTEPVDAVLDAWCRRLGVHPPGRGGVRTSTGTAFLVGDPPRIVTNHHVVAGARRITLLDADGVVLAETEAPGAVRPDARADLAVLDLTLPAPRPGLALGPAPAEGDPLALLGFADDGPLTTRGGALVATIERALPGAPVRPLALTDAAVATGMSGGPALDAAGRVVGVVVAGSTAASDLRGRGVLVPREALGRALEPPRDPTRIGGLLGVRPDGTVTVADGPAWRFGLAAGDRVVALSGRPVDDVEEALIRRDGPIVAEVAGRGFVVIPARDVTTPVLRLDATGRARREDLGSGSPRRASGRDPARGTE